jgi:hypothetical protein
MPHERFYGLAAAEIAERRPDCDLLAKAYAVAGGNAEKTKALYIGMRAEELEKEAKASDMRAARAERESAARAAQMKKAAQASAAREMEIESERLRREAEAKSSAAAEKKRTEDLRPRDWMGNPL